MASQQTPSFSSLEVISLSTPKNNDLRFKKLSSTTKLQKDNENESIGIIDHLDQLNNNSILLTPNSPILHITSLQYTPPISPSKTRRKLFADDDKDHKKWHSKISISRRGIGLLMAFVFLVLLVCLGIYLAKSVQLVTLLSRVQTLGIWGNVVISVVFVLLGLPFFLGYFPMVVASGVLFGLWEGSLTVVIGCLGGSSAGFILTRFCAKERVESAILREKPNLRAILEVVNQNAFKTVFLTRLIPIPFGFTNSLFGVSSVPFHKYIVASTLGLIPFQVSFVYIGTTVRSLAEVFNGEIPLGRLQIGILTGQILLIVTFVIFMGVTTRRMILARVSKQDDQTMNNIGKTQSNENFGNNNISLIEYDPKSKVSSAYKLIHSEV